MTTAPSNFFTDLVDVIVRPHNDLVLARETIARLVLSSRRVIAAQLAINPHWKNDELRRAVCALEGAIADAERER